ncbi:MAG: biotin--[acetyl-CoA-carboxylase] ligase [Magnetospirillum sp.]|nr:biotin--[acetyl-CoA-carboxylase] ligase [Magnetospirillum sp.]
MCDGISLPPPFRRLALDSVGSTNDEARALAEAGEAADCLVVSARRQSAGRGRRGRTWVSPAGNLHCSLLVAVDGGLGAAAQLGFAAAVALVDTLSRLVPGAEFRCKWPNDILGQGRKLAGMLLEPAAERWLVLGLGVDVAAAPSPEAAAFPAVALADLGFGGTADDVLAAFCGEFGPWLARWRHDGFAPVRAAWTARAAGLGAAAVVRLEHESLAGTLVGLDADGALLLDQGARGVRRVLAGDVFFPEARS